MDLLYLDACLSYGTGIYEAEYQLPQHSSSPSPPSSSLSPVSLAPTTPASSTHSYSQTRQTRQSTTRRTSTQKPSSQTMERRKERRRRRERSPQNNWSEEAVRGSWESSHQRSLASSTSPRNHQSSHTTTTPHQREANSAAVSDWLGQQSTQDPTGAVDAVTGFSPPAASPAGSGSDRSTSASAHQYPADRAQWATYNRSATHSGQGYQSPFGPQTPSYRYYQGDSRSYRTESQAEQSPPQTTQSSAYYPGGSSSSPVSSRGVAAYAGEEYDEQLRGVGSFTDGGDPSRQYGMQPDAMGSGHRPVRYKPLTNWFGLWLPPPPPPPPSQ